MKLIRISCVLLAAAPFSFAASKEIIQLQRDMELLQDQVRTLQKSVDQMTALMQQALDSTQKNNTAIAVMQNNVGDALKRSQDMVGAPVANLGAKVDSMGEDFRNLRETVNDLGTRIGKLDQKVTDIQSTINVIRTPAAPPPGSTAMPPATGVTAPTDTMPAATGAPVSTSPPAGMSSEVTYSNAMRDYMGGNYDIALQEFSDYVKYFSNTQFAPNSQFYIGDIYFKRQDYPDALQAFDAVLEHFQDNPKTAAAHLMKGRTLIALGKRDAAAKEFREVLTKYADSDIAPQARKELRNLGLSAPATGTASRTRRRTK